MPVSVYGVCVRVLVCRVLAGDINKSDLEKLVKDKEATELKAAETRRVREGEVVAIRDRSVGRSFRHSVGIGIGISIGMPFDMPFGMPFATGK